MINLHITHNEKSNLANIKWAQVNDAVELSVIANAFEIGINDGRDELVLDVKQVKQCDAANAKAVELFGEGIWGELTDSIVLVYC